MKSAVRTLRWKVSRARVCEDGMHFLLVRSTTGVIYDYCAKTRMQALRQIVNNARRIVVEQVIDAMS